MDDRTKQLLTHFVHGLTPEEMDFVTDTIQACFLDLDENYSGGFDDEHEEPDDLPF